MSESTPFLSPRLVGKRFSDHAIPLEILKDISVLEEMIAEVAKWLYLRDHPDRTRSPRNFTKGISLKLTNIGEGSAVPAIDLFVEDLALVPPLNQRYFETAKNNIVSAVDAAEHDGSITEYLPEALLGYFDRIGRSLLPDEAIEFNPSNESRPSRLNKQTRRKLILSSSKVTVLTDEVSLRGMIPEVDQAKMTFELQISSGQHIASPIVEQHFDTVVQAFNGYQQGIRVLVQGVGRFTRYDKLQCIETVRHISILPDNDIPTRLEELRKIKDGWLDGKGVEPSSDGLDWLAQCFESFYPEDGPLPYIFPTAEGGVQAEWSSGGHEISLEIDLESHSGEWHDLDMSSLKDDFKVLNLNESDTWLWISKYIQGL